MKNCRLSWALVVVLLIIVALFGYRFTVGNVQPSDDGRLSVMLTKDERNALLLEMRAWLQNSQSILSAVSKNDFETITKTAKASGMGAEAGVPGALFRKLPVEMKALGFDTRKKFDDIAADAENLKDGNRIVSKLSVAMNNCVACHAMYRFVETVQ